MSRNAQALLLAVLFFCVSTNVAAQTEITLSNAISSKEAEDICRTEDPFIVCYGLEEKEIFLEEQEVETALQINGNEVGNGDNVATQKSMTMFATATASTRLNAPAQEEVRGVLEHEEGQLMLDVYKINSTQINMNVEEWGIVSAIYTEAVFVDGGSIDGLRNIVLKDSGEYMAVVYAAFPNGVNPLGPMDPVSKNETKYMWVNHLFEEENIWSVTSMRGHTESEYDIDTSTPDTVFQSMSDAYSGFSPSVPIYGVTTFSVEIEAEPKASNVLFLPGIKGSRLYMPGSCGEESCEEKLWDPGEGGWRVVFNDSFTEDIAELFTNSFGESVRDDIYTKIGDVLNEAWGEEYYESFINMMDSLVTDKTINEWEPVAYDWRLALSSVVDTGAESDGRIHYGGVPTDLSYIEQRLRELADTSKTGKVTIIAHSNGGLVTKKLLHDLGDEETSALVDNIIFVGVPQSGAPHAVAGLLFGYEEGISKGPLEFVSDGYARKLAENYPMAYHLLPSSKYFEAVTESNFPVTTFTEGAYSHEYEAYGQELNSWEELSNFALATDGGRTKPQSENVRIANVVNEELLSYGKQVHDELDTWTPPAEVNLYQVAGWGVDTLAQIEFYGTSLLVGPNFALGDFYKPQFTEDGDGVVPVPSALMMTEGENVERWWVDLAETSYKHGMMMEYLPMQRFIRNIMRGNPIDKIERVYGKSPVSNSDKKKMSFYLHSPLTLGIYDEDGNYTGLTEGGEVIEDISGSSYGIMGEVQYINVPSGTYEVSMDGTGDGTFSLEVEERRGTLLNGSIKIYNAPTNEQAVAKMVVNEELDDTELVIDQDGDGVTDVVIIAPADEKTVYQKTLEAETNAGGGSSSPYESNKNEESPSVNNEREGGREVEEEVLGLTQEMRQEVFSQGGEIEEEISIQEEIITDEESRTESMEMNSADVIVYRNEESESVQTISNSQSASVYDAVAQQGWLWKFIGMLERGLQQTTGLVSGVFNLIF